MSDEAIRISENKEFLECPDPVNEGEWFAVARIVSDPIARPTIKAILTSTVEAVNAYDTHRQLLREAREALRDVYPLVSEASIAEEAETISGDPTPIQDADAHVRATLDKLNDALKED